MIEVPRDLIPGKSFKLYYREGNVNNCIMHIRAIVDDDRVVFRWWSRRKQHWVYVIEHMYFFELRRDKITERRQGQRKRAK